MATIIAGQFDTFMEATSASNMLRDAAFAPASIAVFFNNPPGAHDAFPVGGDEDADPGARNAGLGAAAGAALGAAAALAATAVAPLAVIAIAPTAAYVGALAGGVGGTRENEARARRPAGVIAAVALAEGDREDIAIMALRHCGARNIERAEGEIRDGSWIDFDPVARPQLVPGPAEHPALENYPGD